MWAYSKSVNIVFVCNVSIIIQNIFKIWLVLILRIFLIISFVYFEISYRRDYCNLVAGIDDGIGRVVASLENNGMLENTVIFYSSDNGGVPFAGAFNYPFRYYQRVLYLTKYFNWTFVWFKLNKQCITFIDS